MNKVKKVNLDTKELSSLISNLRTLSADIKTLPKEIAEETANVGKEYLDDLYSNTRTDQTIDINSIKTRVDETSTGYSIVATGTEVLYAEFGTGENGLDDPHPLKGKFNLNPYNSGPKIEYNPATGRHFWFYNGFSEGNASGQQMFLTSDYLRNKAIDEIVKKKVGEVISKV